MVDTWTSDAKEAHVIKKLVVGETYTLREEFAPYGYLKATDIQFTVGMDVTNERQKVQITVTKTDSETKKTLEGAVFCLFAKEDIVNKDGKVIVKADTQIERGVTGKDGKVTFTSDLPLGQYYVKELEAPKGYVKSDKTFDVDELMEKYYGLGYEVEDCPPPAGYKDYNEWLVATKLSLAVSGNRTSEIVRA